MNVLDASQKLFDYFLKNEAFIFPESKSSFLLISEDPELDNSAIYLALSELEKGGIISKTNYINKEKKKTSEVWILNRPISTLKQTVEIPGDLANLLAETLNNFAINYKQNDLLCNPMNITDKDIKNLLIMVNLFISNSKNEDKEA